MLKHDTKNDTTTYENVTIIKHNDSLLHNLVSDCITYRLNEKESIRYIEKRYKKISRRHFYRIKNKINSDDSLNDYFDNHARIGFVIDHKRRVDEIESVLAKLMKKWLNITENNADVSEMTRLAETIIHASKRSVELSLANSVISKIKQDIEEANRKNNPLLYPEPLPILSQAKF